MEAARLKAPAPSSRLGVAAAATGGTCPLLSSTPWLPCLANGVGSCCEDPLGEGLCSAHSDQHSRTAPTPVAAAGHDACRAGELADSGYASLDWPMRCTWQEPSGWSSCSEVERMTTSPVVTTKDLHCMVAACRLLRLPRRSGPAEEATGSPLLCPGNCQAEARAGCSSIARMTTIPIEFPTCGGREMA